MTAHTKLPRNAQAKRRNCRSTQSIVYYCQLHDISPLVVRRRPEVRNHKCATLVASKNCNTFAEVSVMSRLFGHSRPVLSSRA